MKRIFINESHSEAEVDIPILGKHTKEIYDPTPKIKKLI